MVSTAPTKTTRVTQATKATKVTNAEKTVKPVVKKVKKLKPAVPEVLAVASEIYPLVKTGGLADVVGALPLALQACAVHVTTLVPGYPR